MCVGSTPCAAGSGGNSGEGEASLAEETATRQRFRSAVENTLMDDYLARREAARPPRRLSSAADVGGANVGPQDGEVTEVHATPPDRPGKRTMEERKGILAPLAGYQRYMPMEPLKFPIPKKTKEQRALFQYVSVESREYEDMMTILNSSFIDTGSAACFTYCTPRLVHSELLDKEFVEKRKEMKAEGRTDKELEESYCFLLTDTVKLPWFCEKGLLVGQSRMTMLGNPNKGVYLSRYSDLIQVNPITPGATGEIIIFKVMKGKVKSMYENMKNLLDPTPRFDSHTSKSASKVTSLTSYRAFELTQQYFYEYSFDELRQRPRQVCPHAVISFQFKGKDSSLPSKPLAPIRSSSQSTEGSKERAQFTVWTGDLVKGDRVLFQISLRSFSPPLLPQRLPEKLEVGWPMRLDQATALLPADLLRYELYSGSREVVKSGLCCSLLEVTDKSRSATSVTRLLQELEKERVVLVTPLSDRGFLLLLSSVQMATPSERGESWKRCLQALFVLPESRDPARATSRRSSSTRDASSYCSAGASGGAVMPRLRQFIPALHHALVKARANSPPELSAGVERQAREYLIGLTDGKARQYPMGEYESQLDEEGKLFPTPKHHRVNMDGYLRSYLYSPALYLLSVARAKQMVEAHCTEEPQEATGGKRCEAHGEAAMAAAGMEATGNARDDPNKHEKWQQLIDLVLTCKRNAENEVRREEGGRVKAPGRKRKLEQATAERTLKFLKLSQEPGRHGKFPVEGSPSSSSSSPGSLASVMGSVGLKDVDLKEDGSEQAAKLLRLLTDLSQAARGKTNPSLREAQEERPRESSPFDRLATKLGLPTSCDIDLRKQDELEEQTAGSVSSLEGFSPGSHSGDVNHYGGRGGGGGGLERRAAGYEKADVQWDIPWILIPITGVCSQRYTQRDRNIPQDPRFQRRATAPSGVATTAEPPGGASPAAPSPERSPPSPSSSPPPPCPSPSQCPSPDPSPPPSPSQCPSPEPSPPPSPSQCPSPELSPASSPPRRRRCLSPRPPAPRHSPPRCPVAPLRRHPAPTAETNELVSTNERHEGSGELAGLPKDTEEKPEGKENENEAPFVSASVRPSIPPSPDRRTSPSPAAASAEREKEDARMGTGELMEVQLDEKETQPVQRLQHQVEKVEMMHAVARDGAQKAAEKEPAGGSLFSPSVFLPPSLIDSVVDKHLSNFSSEMQLLLQEQSVHYSFPRSASNVETHASPPALPHAPISQFSQFVTFYNPCPPVQDYVGSLRDGIDGLLTEFDGGCRARVDSALASRVSDFVSSIRAGNVKTGAEDDGPRGKPTAAAAAKPVSDATNNAHVTLSASKSGSGYTPTNTSVLKPPANKTPQQNHTRNRQTQDGGSARTVHCPPSVEGGSGLAGTNCKVTYPGCGGVSKPSAEPVLPCERVSSPASESVPAPVPAALSSLISRLQPEVFSNLVEIFKDVKRNSTQFYFHSDEAGDQLHKDVKDYLLKLGNMEQSPVAFLNQENSADRLLVIIRNKDIAGHIHTIPSLVSLKRQASVVFVGINAVDDIRKNSCDELFVSGGCIVSDDFVLNADSIHCDQLASLLRLLEQHSSPKSVWRWKVHWQTHKKLKERARFSRDAVKLLELLSIYQKRHIVEFLPYHQCDTLNSRSPPLHCLMELQAQCTQYRHTVFLTENHFETFPAYSRNGIVVASVDKLLHNFSTIVGYHDIRNRPPIIDDMLAPKEHIRPLSFRDQPQHFLLQAGSTLPSLPSPPLPSDQLVPDASSFKEVATHHSETDFEVLRLAISQLRAERQAQQQQQLDSRAELYINSLTNLPPGVSHTASGRAAPGGPAESPKVTRDRKAVAGTLEMIHSALQQEEVGYGAETAGRRRGGGGQEGGEEAGEHKDGTPVRLGRNGDPGNGETSTSSSDQSTASVTGPGTQTGSTSDGSEKANRQGEPVFPKAASYSTTACPVEGHRLRDTQLGQEPPMKGEGAPPGNGTVSGTKTQPALMENKGEEGNLENQIQHHGQPLQQVNNQQQQLQPSPSHLQHLQHQQLPHSQQQQQQQRSVGLLQAPHLPGFPNQRFAHGPMLGPLTALEGGLLGPVWPTGLDPASAAALVLGFQQAGRDFTGPRLLGGYHNPAGQGSSRYRGGESGGGRFNGI